MTNKQQIPSEELKRINDESIEFSENEFDPGDYRDTAYISYKTGKENEYLRAHSSQPSGQLHWVKASEQLPEDNENRQILVIIGNKEENMFLCKYMRGQFWSRRQSYGGAWSNFQNIPLQDIKWRLIDPLQPSTSTVEPGKPHPEDVEQIANSIHEIILKYPTVSDERVMAKEIAEYMASFWSAMDEGSTQWESDCKDAQREVERLKAALVTRGKSLSIKERCRLAWMAARETASEVQFADWWKFFDESNLLPGDLPSTVEPAGNKEDKK